MSWSSSSPPTNINLSDLFTRHHRVHILFSGGKDSVVLVHLCSPWRDQVTLVWSNTGIMWPHMIQFVREYGKTYRLLEASPRKDFRTLWAENGLPSNVVPLENLMGRAQPKMQFWTTCCKTMRMRPAAKAILADNGTAVLHGQRASDRSFQPDHQAMKAYLAESTECAGPLWEWSDSDVMDYITTHRLALPSQYPSISSSLECAICPAQSAVSEKTAAAVLSPPLARCVDAMDIELRSVAANAIIAPGTGRLVSQEDRPLRWSVVEPLMRAALVYDTGQKTLDTLREDYEAGKFDLLTAGRSALLVEVAEAEGQKFIHLYLAAGSLSELRNNLIPQAELLGKLHGCKAAFIGGRKGWIRALGNNGYHFAGRTTGAYSWLAEKSLVA